MGLLDNMSVMLGGLVTRAVGSSLFDWIRAVSQILDQSTDGLSQAAWFIDPVSGNDRNSGLTAATALKTDAERQRRWGNFTTKINQATTVTYLSSPGASDPVNFDVQIGLNSNLQIVGTKQVISISGAPTAALTAVTVLNRGAQTPWDVTAVGLGAAHVGKIIRITAGPRINNYAVVMKDLGAGKVRVTPFGNLQVSSNFVPFVETPAQAGDVVEVFDMPQIDLGTCAFRSGSNQTMTPTTAIVLFDTIKPYCGTVDTASINTTNTAIYFARSILRNCILSGPGAFLMAGGLMIEGFVVDATSGTFVGYSFGAKDCPFCDFAGSNFAFTGFFGSTCVLEGDCLFQNSAVAIAGMVQGSRVSMFDQATADSAFQILPGQVYVSTSFFGGPDLLWGTANTGHGAIVRTGGTLAYVTKPTVNSGLGVGREALIGGTDKVWGAVPFAEATNFTTIAPYV